MNVITSTAARVEINHFEITSNPSHSSFETSGITLSALRHIAKFISQLLVWFWINYIQNVFNWSLTFVRLITEIHPVLLFWLWKCKTEGCPCARFALHPNLASVKFDNPLYKR